MILNHLFTWNSNLEFTFSPRTQRISKKTLYRCYDDSEVFREKVYKYLSDNILSHDIQLQVDKIFYLKEVQDLTFHFAEDPSTWRMKFYISLYGVSFQKSLRILSKIKKVLDIHTYALEKDFLAFDCIWFDICKDRMSLKVYELLSDIQKYSILLPDSFSPDNIKEVGVLKTRDRRKLFFRLKTPLRISTSFLNQKEYISFENAINVKYKLRWEITYYCLEWDKEEIYFI